MKKKIAIIRGKFLNRYEMQSFEPLTTQYDLTAFGSLTPFHDRFSFPVVKLASPMDIPEFPFKMPILNRIFTDSHVLFGLERALNGFDLVHSAETYYFYTRQALAAKSRGIVKKVIATVLENIPFNNEGIRGRVTMKKYARINLDHIIALTERTKQALVTEGTDDKKITVIGHGIDISRFGPGHNSGKKSDELTILFAGRFEVYKGIFDVLNVFSNILKQENVPSVRLVMAGDGTRRKDVFRVAKALGIESKIAVKSVSYDDMPNIYAQADIFMAPSKPTPTYEEQYCTVLLEAQSMGLPIVTTRTGGIPENVGDAAVIVEPGDIDAMTEAVTGFLSSPAIRITYGKKARARAEAVHDARKIAARIAEVYSMVLAS